MPPLGGFSQPSPGVNRAREMVVSKRAKGDTPAEKAKGYPRGKVVGRAKKKPGRKPGPMRHTTADIERAFRATGGMVAMTARRLGVTYKTVYNWMSADPHLKEVRDEVRNQILDLAEQANIRAIKRGDTKVAQWHLMQQGHDRGYKSNWTPFTSDGGESGEPGVAAVALRPIINIHMPAPIAAPPPPATAETSSG